MSVDTAITLSSYHIVSGYLHILRPCVHIPVRATPSWLGSTLVAIGCLRKRSVWCVLGEEGWELVAGQGTAGFFPWACLAPRMLFWGLNKEIESSFLSDGIILGSQ